MRFRFSVVTSSVVKPPLGDVVVLGDIPSVDDIPSAVEVISGCEVDTTRGLVVVVAVGICSVEEVVVMLVDVVGFGIRTGLFGGDIMTLVLLIIALTLDDTETSISSKVTFSEEDSGKENI